MSKLISQILSLIYLVFFKINWITFFRLYNKKSENVIWIYPCFPFQFFEYLGRSSILYDFSQIYATVNAGISFRIVLGRKIGKVHNSKILYHASHEFMNIFRFDIYPMFLVGVVKALENQNNKLFCNAAELEFWENKAYMHKKFAELDVSQPNTTICTPSELYSFTNLSYPFIVKEVHSQGGNGIHKIDNDDTKQKVAKLLEENSHKEIIVQRIVKMTRDLRVTIIGEEIVVAYWRINQEKEWRPTSTSKGSSVDFGNFPEKWRAYFIEVTKKLNLRSAAYDVCWENDDTETMPVILEVSPYFQPNAPLPTHLSHVPYRKYKKMVFTKKPHFKEKIKAYCIAAEKKVLLFFK
jgi:hypothetical protein